MDADDENEYAMSFDTETGRERWRVAVGALFENDYGDVIWSVEALKAFGSKLPVWAFTSAPIVEGDLLIAEVGGTGARTVAAFGKRDGELRWTAVEDELSYSSPIAIDFGGHRQLVFLTTPFLPRARRRPAPTGTASRATTCAASPPPTSAEPARAEGTDPPKPRPGPDQGGA